MPSDSILSTPQNHSLFLSRWRYYLTSIPTLLLGVENWQTMLKVFCGLPVQKPIIIELRNGCRFQVRTRLDIWVLKEACLDDQYESASVSIRDGWNIVDIGAGLGDFAVATSIGHPHCTIHAYEPFPDSFALLQENLRLNHISNVRSYPIAVGSENGSLSLHAVSSEAVQQTTVSASADGVSPSTAIAVQSTTLDQVIAGLTSSRCDFLKMDCEGAEYGIFFNASPGTLERIRHVCLEYHDDVAPYNHQDLVRFFEDRNFAVRCTPSPAHRNLGLLSAVNRMGTVADSGHSSL